VTKAKKFKFTLVELIPLDMTMSYAFHFEPEAGGTSSFFRKVGIPIKE